MSKRSIKFVEAPAEDLKKLEAASARDAGTARVVLGLFGTILGASPDRIFPDYVWGPADLKCLHVRSRNAAKKILTWSFTKNVALGKVLLSDRKISKAVFTQRARSPYSRKMARYVASLRRQYPPLKSGRLSEDGSCRTQIIRILESEKSKALTPRVLSLVRAFTPSTIEVSSIERYIYPRSTGAITILIAEDGYTIHDIRYGAKMPFVDFSRRLIEGWLIDFFETGSEGTHWALEDEFNSSYDALHIMEEGDSLTIQDELGVQLWSGKIKCDRKSGRIRFPKNPDYDQPCALGRWIHWTQDGFKPDDWARFFILGSGQRLRGILVKRAKSKIAPTHESM